MMIAIPSGWSAPSGNQLNAGYFTVTVTSGAVTGSIVLGQDLEIFVQGLNAGGVIRVIYGDRTGGGPGALSQPSAGIAVFTVSSQPSGTTVYKIAGSPSVIVLPATPTITNTITPTYTATANATPVQPSGLISQQNGDNVTLVWNTAPLTSYYRIYTATGPNGRLNPFPSGWNVIATVLPTPGTSSYTDTNTTDDYLFYTVAGVGGAGAGGPSTMASKVRLDFTGGEVYRESLPYNSKYSKASDIVSDIEGSLTTGNKISQVLLWNPYLQTSAVYGFADNQWKGSNWPVDAGTSSSNAFYLNTVSGFSWIIAGTDKITPLIFHFNPPISNANKRDLPYTSIYTKASDIAADIEGNTYSGININTIMKWNPDTQSYIVRYFQTNTWKGPDFSVEPGDMVNIFINRSFTWTPKLAMTPVP